MRLAASRALEFLLLQDPQQLRLQRRGKITDFIKEQCSGISHFETAYSARHSPGKGALFMAKEFAIQ